MKPFHYASAAECTGCSTDVLAFPAPVPSKCWRSPEQSENLSMGEIRRVFRLCVEHLAYGRGIPAGPTKELIEAPMHLYEPSEDIREDLEEVARYAISNRVGWVGSSWPKTFCDRDAEAAEELALEILSDMGEEHERTDE